MNFLTKNIFWVILSGIYFTACMTDPGYYPPGYDADYQKKNIHLDYSVYSEKSKGVSYTNLPECNDNWNNSVFFVFLSSTIYTCSNGNWVNSGYLEPCSDIVLKTPMYRPQNTNVWSSSYYNYLAVYCDEYN